MTKKHIEKPKLAVVTTPSNKDNIELWEQVLGAYTPKEIRSMLQMLEIKPGTTSKKDMIAMMLRDSHIKCVLQLTLKRDPVHYVKP